MKYLAEREMLQYREFPGRTAATFIMFAGPIALNVYIIMALLSGALSSLTLDEHHGLLGFGALAAVFALPLTGFLVDRIRRYDFLLIIAAAITPILGLLPLMPLAAEQFQFLDLYLALSSFAGLAILLVLLTIRINQSIIVRYRGRTIAVLLSITIALVTLYSMFEQLGILLNSSKLALPSLISIILLLAAIALKPWRQPKVRLAASGNVLRYFIPTTLIMASYMLWYFTMKLSFQTYFQAHPEFGSFESLSVLVKQPLFEILVLILGITIAGAIADTRGRKPAFSFALLMMGLLTIFGSTLYIGYFANPDVLLFLLSLLGSERFIEGYLLGLCLCLIWPEVGSVRTKGIRLSLIWFFFLGYMTLFWAVDLELLVFSIQFHIPDAFSIFGGQVAIFSSLIALYLIGHLPTILGREIEIEELAFDFDDRQVKKTVDAYVGSHDFDSIKSQLDIIDAGSELSDNDMSEILGEDSKASASLQKIPGIGEALEKKLKAAGYESAVQLAGETPKRLAQRIDGLSISHAEKLLKDARRIVKKAMKKAKKK
jgi:predicted flap endonuclease-1-like 5' DNA nuclease